MKVELFKETKFIPINIGITLETEEELCTFKQLLRASCLYTNCNIVGVGKMAKEIGEVINFEI